MFQDWNWHEIWMKFALCAICLRDLYRQNVAKMMSWWDGIPSKITKLKLLSAVCCWMGNVELLLISFRNETDTKFGQYLHCAQFAYATFISRMTQNWRHDDTAFCHRLQSRNCCWRGMYLELTWCWQGHEASVKLRMISFIFLELTKRLTDCYFVAMHSCLCCRSKRYFDTI